MKYLGIFCLIVLGIGWCGLNQQVLAQDNFGLSETAGAAELTGYGTSLPGIIGSVLGTGLSLVGVLFFALMLYGGVVWMTARGNSENEKKALGTITAAIIGILIVLGSYAITNFVFSSLKGGGGGGSSGGGQTPPVAVDCTGKTGPIEGCDTCYATQRSTDWECRVEAQCSTVVAEKVEGLCQATGQGSKKCCKINKEEKCVEIREQIECETATCVWNGMANVCSPS